MGLLGRSAPSLTIPGLLWTEYLGCLEVLQIQKLGSNANANVLQVLSILDHRLRSLNRLHPHDALPNIPTPAPSGHCGHGLFHTLRVVDGRIDRYLDRIVGADWKCEWEL